MSERRVTEYLQVADDPALGRRALAGYGEVLGRLNSETDDQNRDRIVPVLNRHADSFKDTGVTIPELDAYLVTQKGKEPPAVPGGKNDLPPWPKGIPTVIVPPSP